MGLFVLGFLLVLTGCVGLFVALRRRHALGALAALAAGALGAYLATNGGPRVGTLSREEQAAQVELQDARARKADDDARATQAAQRASAADAAADRQRRMHAAMVADFAKLSPAERLRTMRAACDSHGPLHVCDEETVLAVVQAAGSDAEKTQLRIVASQLLDASKP